MMATGKGTKAVREVYKGLPISLKSENNLVGNIFWRGVSFNNNTIIKRLTPKICKIKGQWAFMTNR